VYVPLLVIGLFLDDYDLLGSLGATLANDDREGGILQLVDRPHHPRRWGTEKPAMNKTVRGCVFGEDKTI